VASAVEGFKDLSLREAWVIAPVMAVIVALGIYPKPILDIINPAVQSTNSVVRNHDPSPSVPEPSLTNSAPVKVSK
jgi:NADH-quinone oxidoreductase subunit M